MELGLCLGDRSTSAYNLDHRRSPRRQEAFHVRADEKLTAFVMLESAVRGVDGANGLATCFVFIRLKDAVQVSGEAGASE
jgi:hypothetical protein